MKSKLLWQKLCRLCFFGSIYVVLQLLKNVAGAKMVHKAYVNLAYSNTQRLCDHLGPEENAYMVYILGARGYYTIQPGAVL